MVLIEASTFSRKDAWLLNDVNLRLKYHCKKQVQRIDQSSMLTDHRSHSLHTLSALCTLPFHFTTVILQLLCLVLIVFCPPFCSCLFMCLTAFCLLCSSENRLLCSTITGNGSSKVASLFPSLQKNENCSHLSSLCYTSIS